MGAISPLTSFPFGNPFGREERAGLSDPPPPINLITLPCPLMRPSVLHMCDGRGHILSAPPSGSGFMLEFRRGFDPQSQLALQLRV